MLHACDSRTLLFRALDAHPLPESGQLNLVAAGKAGQRMADAFLERYGARTRGVVVARGGHPLPNEESFASGEEALRLADENRARGETLVVLLSGGASAMMAAPAPGVTLADKIAMTRELLRSGLPIAEMNARRKQMSAIKGGKLALRAGRSVTFAISDVHAPVEDDPLVIGSGPTALAKPVEGVETTVVLAGSRRDAMDGACVEALRLGYDVERIDSPTLGEARDAARAFVSSVRSIVSSPSSHTEAFARSSNSVASAFRRKICAVASGETTVTLAPDTAGRGGRNQEFALAAALALVATPGPWALASIGTDGIDGPTDAAGAIVDATTLPRARAAGLDPEAALASHDSYPFFRRLGDLVVTGPTGTNVGDLQVYLSGRVRLQAEGR